MCARELARVVHAPSIGRRQDLSDDVVVLSEHKVCAELFGEVHAEAVVPIHGDDFGGAHRLCRVDGEQADWPEPVNGDGRPLDGASGQRVDRVAKRVLNRGVFGLQPSRDGPCIDRWNDEIGRKSAMVVDAKNGPVFTDVGVSFVAPRTRPTCQMTLDGDQVTDVTVHHAWPDGSNLSARFVAGDRSEGDVLAAPLVPLPDVQVGAADAGRPGANQHLSFARNWDRMLHEVEAIGFVADFCPRQHGALGLHEQGLGPRPLRFDLQGSG